MTVVVLAVALIATSFIAVKEHSRRVDAEDQLAVARMEYALRRHPATRGELPQWWPDYRKEK